MTALYSSGCTGIIAACIPYSTRNIAKATTATTINLRRSLTRYAVRAGGSVGVSVCDGPRETYIISKTNAITHTAKMILFRVLNRKAMPQHTPLYHGCKALVSQ
jgi:hypothetical protein